jgi:DNA invertase Pin-like site-specific DNA recombinase
MIALYARVSTLDKQQNPEYQLKELRDYCQRHQLTVGREYVDVGVSGSKESRPELNRLMNAIKAGEYTHVIVWKFDRFARSAAHLLKALDTLTKSGVQFVSLTEGVDTATPMGKFMLTILGAVGELERSMIIERVKSGMRHAKTHGTKSGQPIGRKRQVDHAEIQRLIASGQSKMAVARTLNVCAETVRRAIQ